MTRCWQKLALLLIVAMAPFAARGAVCTISSTALNFGSYTGSTINATNTITTNCPASVSSYTISLNAGTGAGAITQIRFMTLTYELVYQMFQNSSRTTNWGNTVGTDTVSVTGNTGSNVVSTVYAQLPSGQVPPPGTYTDTITVSVTSTLGTQTGTFAVSAIVSPYCTISANPLAFGTYSGAQLNVNSTVTVECTGTTPYNVGLNQGTAAGATVTTRSMTGPSSTLLSYNLYSNSGLTTNWGNTVGTNTVAGTGTGGPQSLTVYGQIPAGQYKVPGSYTDTVTATITY